MEDLQQILTNNHPLYKGELNINQKEATKYDWAINLATLFSYMCLLGGIGLLSYYIHSDTLVHDNPNANLMFMWPRIILILILELGFISLQRLSKYWHEKLEQKKREKCQMLLQFLGLKLIINENIRIETIPAIVALVNHQSKVDESVIMEEISIANSAVAQRLNNFTQKTNEILSKNNT